MCLLRLVLLAVVLSGCEGRAAPEPPTDLVRRPEIIGVVTSWDWWQTHEGSYTLDTGEVVELNVNESPDLPATPRLSETDIYFPYGGESYGEPIGSLSVLLLVGHDPDGTTWYAAAHERNPLEDCPFEIEGAGVYDEGDALHFSTGLLLPKSSDFSIANWYDERDPFPLRRGDRICLDRAGTALSATVWLPF